jgi:LysR family transcriptional regulator, glycine cleavage system transcriptional activator
MTTTSHLRALQALELAVRTGSLKRTAELLSITPAAAGQRIRALEEYLGFELLVRGRLGIRPTAKLQAALPHLAVAFRELEQVTEILDFQRVGEIHVVADSDWADLWLARRLDRFKAENPSIRFCVNGIGDVPLRLGQFDCEVWFGEPVDDGSDLLFRDYLVPVSSPENTARVSRLPMAQCLEGFPLLHLDGVARDPAAIGWPEWIDAYGARRTATDRGFRYRHRVHALEAVRSDAGILLCGLALVLDDVEDGNLSLPFPPAQGAWTQYGFRIRFRADALRRSQVQRFREWLLAEARLTEERMISLTKAAAAGLR